MALRADAFPRFPPSVISERGDEARTGPGSSAVTNEPGPCRTEGK